VTAAMENYTLPADVLAFFEKEIFNSQHWDVTRNNMANALVCQESPNPRLSVEAAERECGAVRGAGVFVLPDA